MNQHFHYINITASSEKISNAFSWLPSRSPKRSARNTNPESALPRLNGVISSSDTLSSLAASSPDYIPIFIKKCIEYIEKVRFNWRFQFGEGSGGRCYIY